MKVKKISSESILFGQVRPGWTLVAINGKDVIDSLDFQFRSSDERVRLLFHDSDGRPVELEVDGLNNDLGLIWEDERIRRCKCRCIFCFVHQQPKGMRRALYIKDEDYRLSFTHGNFITLSNMNDADLERIIEQRLSPLYISVHTTNDELRRKMLGNAKLQPVLEQLRCFAAGGIFMHTQVVLCPGINDGPELERTIGDLAGLYPKVATLAVVPVGLTRYRDRLPGLRTYTRKEAAMIVQKLHRYQQDFLKELGTRFVWAADEFYISSGMKLPSRKSYESMEQFENGVGMMREFVTVFNYRRRALRRIKSSRRVLFVTGKSAEPTLMNDIWPFLTKELGLFAQLVPVVNRFWGETVTVSGLLVGRDIHSAVKDVASGYDCIVLPPNCINEDNLFLDDMSLDQLREWLRKPIILGSYNFADTIAEVYQ